MHERPGPAAAALRTEARFVLALGGYALELAGGTLVLHEKIPSPRFNFALVGRVAPDRQAAFFERTLDHYFQRAIRPEILVPFPAEDHVDRGLRRFAFERAADPSEVWVHAGGAVPPEGTAAEVRFAGPEESEAVTAFWSEPGERPELRQAIDLAVHHPTPGEELRPILAVRDGAPAAAALWFGTADGASVHLVTTRPTERGQGLATAIVRFALEHDPARPTRATALRVDAPRIGARLATLGFVRAATFQVYRLPPTADLDLPSPGPPGPPRWRPPRGREDRAP